MATFNSMPGLSTGASPSDPMAMNLGAGQPQGLGLDVFDQELTFDESLLDGTSLQNLPFTPSYDLETFSTTFEDPFSYSSRQFEPAPNQDVLHEEESPQELDNKLLGFSAPISSATVIDEAGQFSETAMTAELYGMFFVAEDVFGGETSGRPLELTCYRRNLWQCSGQITLPRTATNVVNEQGIQIQIFELIATITATESIEGKPTEIISIPWKNATAPPGEESKIVAAPPNITLDLTSGQEVDANQISMPISWKRLQFKHATANNGRRKGLQQHYVVRIGLLGKTKSGDLIQIAEIQSGPVIVRGRSPRNFDSKKDVPLTSDKRVERRNTATPDPSTIKMARENSQAFMQRYNSLGNIQPGKAAAVVGQNTDHSPSEDADPLYEYFPLTVDDWMPPVDAVYRPHVVHHTIVPPEMKAQQLRSKAKRYFAPE
ncbi:hypothetical protein G7Z17_g9907 [Cylindrodendrum hubeiense]|uniref:NDT80 domain-containing protein n=1 Tax=Cylindrodendrum hubeiense TaxID=595255 RepID=A0A9P5H332_9HYPO|nr:hypothetical protein G7Z17_g9907 [Cylindrodendrum hubeiense]